MEQPIRPSPKPFVWILSGIVIVLILLGVFQLGVSVGFKKARFMNDWGEHYDRVFPPRMGDGRMGTPPGPFNPHGAIGNVLSADENQVVLKNREGIEQSIAISSSTEIRRDRERIAPKDIKPNEPVMVFGDPDELGQIRAKLIRVLQPDFNP